MAATRSFVVNPEGARDGVVLVATRAVDGEDRLGYNRGMAKTDIKTPPTWVALKRTEESRTRTPMVIGLGLFALVFLAGAVWAVVGEGLTGAVVYVLLGLAALTGLGAYDASLSVGEIQNGTLRAGGRLFQKSVALDRVASWNEITRYVGHIIPMEFLVLYDRDKKALIDLESDNPACDALIDVLEDHFPTLKEYVACQSEATLRDFESQARREGKDIVSVKKIVVFETIGFWSVIGLSAGLFLMGGAWTVAGMVPAPLTQVIVALYVVVCALLIAPFIFFELPIGPFDLDRGAAGPALIIGAVLCLGNDMLVGACLDPWPLVGAGLQVGVVVALLLMFRAKLSKTIMVRGIQLFLIAASAIPTLFLVNRVFDSAPAVPTPFIVAEKLPPHKVRYLYTMYVIHVHNPYRAGSTAEISVSEAVYAKLQPGDKVSIPVHRGFLDSRWVQNLR